MGYIHFYLLIILVPANKVEKIKYFSTLLGLIFIVNTRGPSIVFIRYESDDVIWLRNHASTWILVPNIGCKQTMASNTGGPLTSFFGVHTFFFLITPRQYEEEKFRSNQTTLLTGGPVKLDSMWQHRLTRLVRDRYMYSIRTTV